MIPKKIHYCWFGGKEKPKEVQKCIASWKKFCPDYEIIEWNEKNYDLDKNPDTRKLHDDKIYGFLADPFRFDVIYEYGGIYLDTDVELLKSLDDLLDNDGFIGFESDDEVNTGQGFGAVAKHPFVKEEQDYYRTHSFYDKNGKFRKVVSPKITTAILKKHGLKLNNKNQTVCKMRVFPREYFCPLKVGTNKLTITENTYSIHHFDASWKGNNKITRKMGYYLIPIKKTIKKVLKKHNQQL